MNSDSRYLTAPLLYEDTLRTFYGTPEFSHAMGAMLVTFASIRRAMAK